MSADEVDSTYVDAEVDYTPVNVHVLNMPTEEVAAQHVTTMTFATIAPNLPQEVLQLNPLRKRTVLSVTGAGTVTLCHSQADAQAASQGLASAGIPITNVAAAASIVFEYQATAKLWAFITGAATLGVMTEQRSA